MHSLQLDRPAQEVLDQIHHADNLLQAIGTGDDSLAVVQPEYTAIFYLRHPEKAEEMIQLEIDFKANTADAGFEASKALWMKGPKPDAVAQAAPLEIFNVRLHRYLLRSSLPFKIDLTGAAASLGSLRYRQTT